MSDAPLVKFNDQAAILGSRRETLKEIAIKLGTSETKAVHIAINRLHADLFHGDQDYDFPTKQQIERIEAGIPTGKTKTTACTCDRCHREMQKGEVDCEWQERLIISFRCGYGSVFGDGNLVECNFCQQCVKDLLGEYLRITEDNPFDSKHKPQSEPYHAHQNYQLRDIEE